MYAVRKWSVSRARYFDRLYQLLEQVLVKLDALWLMIGYDRVEKPITYVEKLTKGFLFDCQMCGNCVLHDTGMACPMNCPKELRNGPCGGVRADGRCEVDAKMRCVWVEAWRGHKLMNGDGTPLVIQLPTDHQLRGRSSWLRAAREKRHQAFLMEDEA